MSCKSTQLVLMMLTITALLLPLAVLASGENREVTSIDPLVSTSDFARGFTNEYEQASSRAVVDTKQKHQEQATSNSSSSIMFIENVGQWDEDARFQVWGGTSDSMWLAEDAIWITVMEPVEREQSLVLSDDQGRMSKGSEVRNQRPDELRVSSPDDVPHNGINIKVSFPSANPHPTIEIFDRQETIVSYFLGSDPDKWQPDVPVWGGVRYVDLWPGVNLEVGSEDGRMVQRFVVEDWADVGAVRMQVEGANAASLTQDGLQLATDVQEIMLPTPRANFAYQMEILGANGQVDALEVQRTHVFTGKEPQVGVAPADNPADLLYSTLLGGSGWEYGRDIAVDGAGNAYVTGYTYSSDFPTMPGAFDTSYNGSADAFVVKLNSAGSGLVYATFLGGGDWEYGDAIAVDGVGNAFVASRTSSSDFPTTPGAFDTSFNYDGDAFVAKLNSSGSGLVYATFLGGSDYDPSFSIAVDGTGNAFVTGRTSSSDFPTTPDAFDTSFNGGGSDAFVAKLNPVGSGLAYATFLGGSISADSSSAITVDGAGNAFVTDNTWSSDFPTTPGAFDTSYNGSADTFVTKLAMGGGAIRFTEFLAELQSAVTYPLGAS